MVNKELIWCWITLAAFVGYAGYLWHLGIVIR
jgi:hypothetical protein